MLSLEISHVNSNNNNNIFFSIYMTHDYKDSLARK